MESSVSGVVRFLAHPRAFVILEVGGEIASASLTVAWQRTFGGDPDISENGDCTAGIHFPLDTDDDTDVRGMCISRSAKGDSVGVVARMLVAKYGLDRVQTMNRPPMELGSGVGGASDVAEPWSWVRDLARENYNADAVEIWPRDDGRSIRDRVLIEHADEPGHFVHRARRSPRVDWCLPATTLEEALVFSCPENAQEFLRRRGATERNPLALRWKSAVQALFDQEAAHAKAQIKGMTG